MYKSLLMLAFLSSPIDIEYVSDSTEDMAKDMHALELFLSDKVNHEKYCKDITWEQPDIDVYKEKLETQLPESCKARLPQEE